MKILVGPINLAGQISIDPQNPNNPGIGGSEYQSIILASVLSQDHKVSLWLRSGSLNVSGLRTIEELDAHDDFDLQISFTSSANEKTPKVFPLVAISHHPFDSHILNLPPRTLAVANVGQYQFHSNQWFANRAKVLQIWLPVLLRKPQAFEKQRLSTGDLHVGHVSSLHPSKGFHDVLAAWMGYVALGGKGKLEVLGGQSLYGLEESHPTLPVSKQYGDKLLKIMGGKVHETVQFMGRVSGDISPRIAAWHLAILNPKGFGESESVAMKDCWRESVPVIAGNRFGQRDYMRLFPTLAKSSPRQISKLVKGLSENPTLLWSLQSESQSAYQALFERGVESGILWRTLALKVAQGKPLEDTGMPTSAPSFALRLQILFEGLQVWFQEIATGVFLLIARRRPKR